MKLYNNKDQIIDEKDIQKIIKIGLMILKKYNINDVRLHITEGYPIPIENDLKFMTLINMRLKNSNGSDLSYEVIIDD